MRIQLIDIERSSKKKSGQSKTDSKEGDPPDCSAVEVILSGGQTSMEI